MADVRVTLIEDMESLWARHAEWDALVARSATRTVFQTAEWHRSWWETLSDDAKPLVLVAEEAGRIVGIAPLMLSMQRILGRRRRVVQFMGVHASDFCDFIVDPSQVPVVVPLMLAWLAEHAERWDLLHLTHIAEASPLLEAVPDAFGRRGYSAEIRRLYDCPTRLLGDRAEDQKMLKKKTLRRHQNGLRRRGRLEYRVYSEAADVERHLDAFFQQHIDRWAGTPTPSFFREDRQRRFYRTLTRLLAPKGWVTFSVLSLDEVPVAFHFGFEYEQRIFVIKPSFNPEFQRSAPGLLQITFLLEHAMTHGLKEVDFTIGEESYKYRFANHVRSSYAVRVHAPAMFYGLDRLLVHAKAVAKRVPAVSRLGRRVLQRCLGDSASRLGL